MTEPQIWHLNIWCERRVGWSRRWELEENEKTRNWEKVPAALEANRFWIEAIGQELPSGLGA